MRDELLETRHATGRVRDDRVALTESTSRPVRSDCRALERSVVVREPIPLATTQRRGRLEVCLRPSMNGSALTPWSVLFGAAVAIVLCAACRLHGGALGGGGCTTNAECTSGVCQGGSCVDTSCSCGKTQCSESGSASTDCAPHWLCVHSFGNPFYEEPAGNTCMPECGWCPAGFACTVTDKTICDYAPGAAANDAGSD